MRVILLVVFVLFQIDSFKLFAQSKAQIFVHAPVLSLVDSMKLYSQKERIVESFRNPYRTLIASNKDGIYSFELDSLDVWTWINMNLSFQKLGGIEVPNIMEEMLVEVDDSVHVQLKPKRGMFFSIEDGYNNNIPMLRENWDATFSGRGAAKYEVLWKIKQLNEGARRTDLMKGMTGNNVVTSVMLQFQLRDESLLILDTYKSKLNPNTYKLLELQVMGSLGYELGRALVSLHRYAGNKNDEVIKSYLRMFMNNYFEQVSSAILHIDESSISSPRFIDYLVEYTWLSFIDQYKGGGNVVKEWYELSKKLVNSSLVRDRILASILMKRFQDKPQEDLLADAFLTLKDSLSLHKIATLKNLIKGTYAYKFSLPDVFGKFYKAEDYKGKVIFMDFWYASCLPCRDYMRNVVGPLKKIYKNNTDVVFITVSTDKFEVFKAISKKDDFFIDGGVNLYTNNELFKHPIIQHYQIRSYPYPLLIGKDGKLLTGLFDLKSIEGLKYAIDTALK